MTAQARGAREIVDLTHPIDGDIPMFYGLSAPEIAVHGSFADMASHYAPGVSFQIHRYVIMGNTGTYLDAPSHRYADGIDLARLSLERLADVPGVVLDVSERVAAGVCAIDAADVEPLDVAGRALLLHTGWDARWGRPDYQGPGPYFTEAAAELLLERGVALLGTDAVNVDDMSDGRRPVHSLLLANNIPIIEQLTNLASLTGRAFQFHAAPLPLRGGSSVPVRAYAVVDD